MDGETRSFLGIPECGRLLEFDEDPSGLTQPTKNSAASGMIKKVPGLHYRDWLESVFLVPCQPVLTHQPSPSLTILRKYALN